jgi:hypothetical protein
MGFSKHRLPMACWDDIQQTILMGNAVKKRTVLLVFYIFTFLAVSGLALARTPAAVPEDDIFVPTSGWLVGPATLAANSDGPSPCVMADQFNNGFLFRFSGGGRKLLAMAVDFRQQAFQPGQSYAVTLGVGSAFRKTVPAQAYDAATLLINLQNEPLMYQLLGSNDTLQLGIGKKEFEFAMLGVGDGLKRLETCYDPGAATGEVITNAQQDNAIPRIPPIARDSGSVDPSYTQALNHTALGIHNTEPADEAAEAGAALGMHSLTNKPALTSSEGTPTAQASDKRPAANTAATTPVVAAQTPADDANSGSLVDRMLKKAAIGIRGLAPSSGDAGQMEDAMTPGPPKIIKVDAPPAAANATINAASDSAASNTSQPDGHANVPEQKTGYALAQTWTSSAIQPGRDRDIIEGMPRTMGLHGGAMQATADTGLSAAGAPVTDGTVQSYRAMNGSDLRDILTLWSDDNNVKLVWQANGNYAVKQSLSQQGDYKSAVQDVLEQYDGDPIRPVGHLYQDSITGQKTLLIQQQSSSSQ